MNKYVEVAVKEINEMSFAVTRQYLEVNEVSKNETGYVVERLAEDADSIVVFFKIENEPYFLGIAVDKSDLSTRGAFVQNSNRCYLTATSDQFTLHDLATMSTLRATSGWSKGDLSRNGKIQYAFSRFNYEPLASSCYSTEEAVAKLLDFLEDGRSGVLALSNQTEAYISICKHQYVSANKGIHFDTTTLARLAALNLAVDIDMYVVGNEIKD